MRSENRYLGLFAVCLLYSASCTQPTAGAPEPRVCDSDVDCAEGERCSASSLFDETQPTQTRRCVDGDTLSALCRAGEVREDPLDPTNFHCAPDSDEDGVPVYLDCDDTDPSLGAQEFDGDCDGTLTEQDCDDEDSDRGSIDSDRDCDGVGAAEDCDDEDGMVGSRAQDADCDRIPSVDDCDDDDASVGSRMADGDCDGNATAADCDDNDPNSTIRGEDADCDGVLTSDDCNDGDPSVLGNANDADCDGVETSADCDDENPRLGEEAADADCDGVLTEDDCDDESAARRGRSADGICYAYIEPGTFTMGSPASELGRWDDETPHQVTLTRPFLMAETETTQGAWRSQTEEGPSYFDGCGDACPVDSVEWLAALIYANQLSDVEGLEPSYPLLPGGCEDDVGWMIGDSSCSEATFTGLDCTGYRLPTEAEWEYAYRAGTETAFYNGDITSTTCIDENQDLIGWSCGNAVDTSRPVAQKLENAFGLFDMSGNIGEWVWDGYAAYDGDAIDPLGNDATPDRVIRGGSWLTAVPATRAAARNWATANSRGNLVGFRLARTVPESE